MKTTPHAEDDIYVAKLGIVSLLFDIAVLVIGFLELTINTFVAYTIFKLVYGFTI